MTSSWARDFAEAVVGMVREPLICSGRQASSEDREPVRFTPQVFQLERRDGAEGRSLIYEDRRRPVEHRRN